MARRQRNRAGCRVVEKVHKWLSDRLVDGLDALAKQGSLNHGVLAEVTENNHVWCLENKSIEVWVTGEYLLVLVGKDIFCQWSGDWIWGRPWNQSKTWYPAWTNVREMAALISGLNQECQQGIVQLLCCNPDLAVESQLVPEASLRLRPLALRVWRGARTTYSPRSLPYRGLGRGPMGMGHYGRHLATVRQCSSIGSEENAGFDDLDNY